MKKFHFGTETVALPNDVSIDDIQTEISNAMMQKDRWVAITANNGKVHTIWASDGVPMWFTDTSAVKTGRPRVIY